MKRLPVHPPARRARPVSERQGMQAELDHHHPPVLAVNFNRKAAERKSVCRSLFSLWSVILCHISSYSLKNKAKLTWNMWNVSFYTCLEHRGFAASGRNEHHAAGRVHNGQRQGDPLRWRFRGVAYRSYSLLLFLEQKHKSQGNKELPDLTFSHQDHAESVGNVTGKNVH